MITYIVSVYFGKRRSKNYNRFWDSDIYYFVKAHIQKLNELSNPDIKTIVFVVNHFNHTIDQGILAVIKGCDSKIPVEVVFRQNKNFSYGAWNDVIKQRLDEEVDYYFLIEDDYIPNVEGFYKPFIEQMTPDTAYVAQLMNFQHSPIHASISNGLLSYKAAKHTYEKFGDVFSLSTNPTKISEIELDYKTGTENQISFLENLTQNYKVADVSTTTYIPFLESFQESDVLDRLVNFGNHNMPEVIVPVQQSNNLFKFRRIQESDANLISKIRNLYAKEYLHDSTTFTVSETATWIKKTNPEFYIINYLGHDIGYFRTSNYSKQNSNIYVGCDISPEFTGQGLGYLSYISFLTYIFKKYDLHKISLEVLSTNTRAIKLYEKIGFVKEGVKRQDVIKNDKYIDSIIYSILKTEFIKK